ncbi:hypothetical protein CL622_07465 [archaeon]|nr:hypothetical protein [archaeon]
MTVYTSQNEFNFLLEHLNPSVDLLEYGSGGSTVLLQDKVNSITSIEHDRAWYEEIKTKITDTVNYYHVPPNNNDWEEQYDKNNRKNSKGDDGSFEDFAEYVTFPLKLNKKFDIIFVDGRARLACTFMSTFLLKDNGKLFIHDFGTHTSHPYLPYRTYYDDVFLWFKYHSHVESMHCFNLITDTPLVNNNK